MDPSGLTLWLGERLMRVAESLLARSARRRSYDAEVLEASIRVLSVATDARLATRPTGRTGADWIDAERAARRPRWT